MTPHPGWALGGVFVALTIPLGVWAAHGKRDADARRAELAATTPQETRDGFARSKRCEACHPSQYASWHRGYHRTMTQYATPTSVRGNFDRVHLEGGGYDVDLFRRGDDFYVSMIEPRVQYMIDFGQLDPSTPPQRVHKRVSLVTGSHHMQAYWVPSDLDDNAQFSMPFTYLLEDQRWVPRGEVFLHPPDAEHERHQIQVWNEGCITCHSTAGQPRLRGAHGAETRVAEMGIACEACHGPGDAHVAANTSPLRRYAKHLSGGGDDTIVNPARLPAARANEVCGQCHALTDLSDDIYHGEGKAYRAGDELDATQPLMRPTHPTPALERHVQEDPSYLRSYAWSDGTIRVSSRDMSGLIESKCMQSGTLWCGSCHSFHQSDPTNLLADGMDTDAACTGCHPAIGAAIDKHTHHRAGSSGSRCFNCHMPYTVYGLLKAIRNHRIDSPIVTGRSGGDERPNACNLCHVDRSLRWTAGALARWYGTKSPSNLDDTPAAIDWLLSGDAVLRAVAAWQFGSPGAREAAPNDAAVPYLVAALDDPYSAVRYVAAKSLAKLVPSLQFDYLAPLEQRRAAVERFRTHSPEIAARIRTLVDRRDNTPVRALE